jgi:hypothetical protein
LSAPNFQEGGDVEINSVSPFDTDHEMEIAASSAVPHSPTGSKKMNQVQRERILLEFLEPIRQEMWQYIATLDDLLFY